MLLPSILECIASSHLNGRHLSLSLGSAGLALGDVTKTRSNLLAQRVCGLSGEIVSTHLK